MISFDAFKQLDIRIGTVISAERIEGADKLLKLMFDIGLSASLGQVLAPVQILAGIAEHYDPEALVGKQVPIIVNLEPKTLKGQISNGMMLAAVVDGKPVLLHPDKEVPPGSEVR